MASSEDPDETAHEPSYLDLHCLKKCLSVYRAERVKKLNVYFSLEARRQFLLILRAVFVIDIETSLFLLILVLKYLNKPNVLHVDVCENCVLWLRLRCLIWVYNVCSGLSRPIYIVGSFTTYILRKSLRKHAYSNILKILPPKNETFR